MHELLYRAYEWFYSKCIQNVPMLPVSGPRHLGMRDQALRSHEFLDSFS